jgi:hypothetical protein
MLNQLYSSLITLPVWSPKLGSVTRAKLTLDRENINWIDGFLTEVAA